MADRSVPDRLTARGRFVDRLRRRLLCWGHCPCRLYEDDGGCGGQCVRCGRIVGYVTRAELRAYADREIARNGHQRRT
jgi:hypothetical protein